MTERQTYNLVREPFLPCRFNDGSAKEMSLMDCLIQSHEIRELEDPSPLVMVSLHRFLLAVLHSAFRGPKDGEERVSLRQAGRWDEEKIKGYLNRWQDSFDLFHPKKPFYQSAQLQTKKHLGPNKLLHELSAGNNPILFDHTMDKKAGEFAPAIATRALIATQSFAISSGKSEFGHTKDSPLIGKAICLIIGKNLFETLWLNLLIYNLGREEPISGNSEDKPWWENESVASFSQPAHPNGWLDLLTWQSRAILLHRPPASKNILKISFAQGRDFKPSRALLEPMSAFRHSAEDIRALCFQKERAFWRDSTALFQFGEADECQGPATIRSLGRLPSRVVSRNERNNIALFGLCNEQADILYWGKEALPLFMEYLDNPQLVAGLKIAIQMAEEVGKAALNSSARVAAEARLENPGSGSRPDKDRVSSLVLSLGPVRHYWSMVETPFRQLMDKFAQPGAEPPKLLTDWFHQILRPCALRAFEDAFGRLTSGRDLRGHAIGRKKLVMALGKIRNSHNIQAPGSQTIIPEESISHEQ